VAYYRVKFTFTLTFIWRRIKNTDIVPSKIYLFKF